MNVVHQARELAAGGHPVCAAIGVFDGIHRGHQHVIGQSLEAARRANGLAVVITFDRHPSTVLAPQHAPPAIYSLRKKLEVLAALELDAALVYHFTRTFSEHTGEQFVRELAAGFGRLHSIHVGRYFTFGYRRQGNLALLETLGQELGFSAYGVVPVEWQGKVISSTRIREAIQSGNFAAAQAMLGRPYTLEGRVIQGDRIGRQLGFPTANLDVEDRVIPPHGVYAVRADIQGQTYAGVLNIGQRPTLAQPQPHTQIEVHLLDFAGELYGTTLEVSFAGRLRAEQKFPSRVALQAQIAQDIAAARTLLLAVSPGN